MAHQATARANTQLNMFLIPAMGAAYGTAKSGTGIAAMAVMRPEAIMKSIIPVSGFDFEILNSNVPIHTLSKFSRIFHPRSSWRVSSPSTGWWWPSSSPASSRPLGLAQTTHFTSEASRIKIFMKIEANIHCMILSFFLT